MLRILDLTKTYGNQVLFDKISYHFPASERIALVGANGAGKTTLLNIITGLDNPDDGKIVAPNDLSIGFLPQKPNENPADTVISECQSGAKKIIELKRLMEALINAEDEKSILAYESAESEFRLAGGYLSEARAHSILSGLGFSAEMTSQSPRLLSGGWRMRLELAKLFMSEPDFLILDEPTNHLDLPSLVWVENFLKEFRGTLLFVSHDKDLLNRLATVTVHLSNGNLNTYKGNFDQFLAQREAQLAQENATKDQLRRNREKMEQFVERFGAKATKARQAQSRLKMIARIRDLEDNIASERSESEIFMEIPDPINSPRILLTISSGSIGYNKVLAHGINLQVERQAKIAIIGANGVGKSTLLRTISGLIPPISGQFEVTSGVATSYFAQDQSELFSQEESVLKNLLDSSSLSEREARNLLGGFLFRGDSVYKPVKVLSGGEASRLGLACALAKKSSLIFLDEPTNHLDMATVECLSASLGEWTGTLIFVSHDRSFINGLATHIFAISPNGHSQLFVGNLDDYVQQSEQSGFPNIFTYEANSVTNPEKTEHQNTRIDNNISDERIIRELKRKRQSIQKQITKIEHDMEEVRQKVLRIDAKLSAADHSDHSLIVKFYNEKNELDSSLNKLEGDWIKLNEDIENIIDNLARSGRS